MKSEIENELHKLQDIYFSLLSKSSIVALIGIFVSYHVVKDFMEDDTSWLTVFYAVVLFGLSHLAVYICNKRSIIVDKILKLAKKV